MISPDADGIGDQLDMYGRLFGSTPDADPENEVDRKTARRHIWRALVAGATFIGVGAIGAVLATLWPQT